MDKKKRRILLNISYSLILIALMLTIVRASTIERVGYIYSYYLDADGGEQLKQPLVSPVPLGSQDSAEYLLTIPGMEGYTLKTVIVDGAVIEYPGDFIKITVNDYNSKEHPVNVYLHYQKSSTSRTITTYGKVRHLDGSIDTFYKYAYSLDVPQGGTREFPVPQPKPNNTSWQFDYAEVSGDSTRYGLDNVVARVSNSDVDVTFWWNALEAVGKADINVVISDNLLNENEDGVINVGLHDWFGRKDWLEKDVEGKRAISASSPTGGKNPLNGEQYEFAFALVEHSGGNPNNALTNYVSRHNSTSFNTDISPSGGITWYVHFYWRKPGSNPKGNLVFTPDKTSWTNLGKTGEGSGSYRVNVRYAGDNPAIQKGTATIRHYEVIANPPGQDGSPTPPTIIDYTYTTDFDVRYRVQSIAITGATNTTINGASGDVYITQEGQNLQLNGEVSWAAAEYTLPSPGANESIVSQVIPPPPPKPTGSSGYYNIDWTTPVVSYISESSTYWTNEGKPTGYPLNFTLYEKTPGSGFTNTTWRAEDSSYYGNSQNGSAPYGGKGNHNVNLRLKDGMYYLRINREDISNTHSPRNEGSNLYGEYLVDITNPDQAKFNYRGAVLENGIYEYMCDFNNEIDVTIGDNLSGTTESKYMWSQDENISLANLENNSSSMTTINRSRVVSGNWTTSDRNKYSNTFTLNIHDHLTDYPKQYKDLKKGKWYLYIYQRDRAGNITVTRSEPIFVNKIEDFKSTFVHDIRWQHLFQDEVGKAWSNEKKKFLPTYGRNGNTFDVSQMPLNGHDYNIQYGTNIKKGYYTEWSYNSFGFNGSNSRIDILVTYYYWDGEAWSEIGTSPYSGQPYNLYFESDGVHYYPLSKFPEIEEGKLIDEHIDDYLKDGGTDFTHIYGPSVKKVKFYNYRNVIQETSDPLMLKNSWDMRYAFPFAEAIRNSNYDFGKSQLKDRTKTLQRPILVNFNIIGTKFYSNGEYKQHFYTFQEDRWKDDPDYPKVYRNSPGNGCVMIINSDKDSLDDMYVELN